MMNPEGIEAYEQFCFPRGGRPRHKPERRPLTDQQEKVFNLASVGWKPSQIAERMKIPVASVYDAIAKIRHWGYNL